MPSSALIQALVALAKARASAATATQSANRLHTKFSRVLPTTEADRVSAATELDAAYKVVIKCTQEERQAALLCLRIMEGLANVEGGSGRFSSARPEEREATAADIEPLPLGPSGSPTPGATGGSRPSGAPSHSPHPYGSAPGWGAEPSEADESSVAGGGEEGEEGGEESSVAGGEEGGEDDEGASELDSEMADEEAAGSYRDEDYAGSEIGDSMNVAGSELDDDDEVDPSVADEDEDGEGGGEDGDDADGADEESDFGAFGEGEDGEDGGEEGGEEGEGEGQDE
jgi:hypothetical protein